LWSRLRKGYSNIKAAIKQELEVNDALGIKPSPSLDKFLFNEDWSQLPTSKKIDAFMLWLDEQVTLQFVEVDWYRKTITNAYRKGAKRAFSEVKKGKSVTQSPDFFQGTQAQFMESAFAQPVALDKVAVVFGQAYEALTAVNAAMASDLRRVLAEGLISGRGIAPISKEIYETLDGISKKRARLIAQTEIIRAHAEGALDAYKALGISDVFALVEFSTAGDDRVCPKCKALNGKVYTIEKARGVIPVHPGCRCTWIPYTSPELLKK
jgi:SPP1 gp7 family putative phage head morphogenesis protein